MMLKEERPTKNEIGANNLSFYFRPHICNSKHTQKSSVIVILNNIFVRTKIIIVGNFSRDARLFVYRTKPALNYVYL